MQTNADDVELTRRPIGAVQNLWLRQMTELVRFAVDHAASASGRNDDERR